MNDVYRQISENIRKYRQSCYLTQESLARKSQVSMTVIRQIENNSRASISLNALYNIAQALDIPLYQLFINVK